MSTAGLPIFLTPLQAPAKPVKAATSAEPSSASGTEQATIEFPLAFALTAHASIASPAQLEPHGGATTQAGAQPGGVAAAVEATLSSALMSRSPMPGQEGLSEALEMLASRSAVAAGGDAPAHAGPVEQLDAKVAAEPVPGAVAALGVGGATASDHSHILRSAARADHLGMHPLQTPVGSAAWGDELGTRLAWMAERGQHSASLKLSPEHLGPLEVRITLRDDQATVWFGAAHADTRAAIEHALPRLRELFASEGLSLADAGVFHEPPRQDSHGSTGGAAHGGAEGGADLTAPASAAPVHLGLLDTYA